MEKNNELIEFKVKEKTIDSREVAIMMEKEHSKILRMLDGDKTHVGIIPTLSKAQLVLSDYSKNL